MQELLALVRVGELKFEDIESHQKLTAKRQSKLGDTLSTRITQRVIVLVLLMILLLPLISYSPANYGAEYSTKLLHRITCNSTLSEAVRKNFTEYWVDSLEYSSANVEPLSTQSNRYLLYLKVDSSLYSDEVVNYNGALQSYRESVLQMFKYSTVDSGSTCTTHAIFSQNPLLKLTAEYSIILIIVVGVILVIGSIVFTDDAQVLVLDPIDRMMNMVEAVAKDPLCKYNLSGNDDGHEEEQETKLLEKTIEKITGLLRVGFGEAGAGIISANLQSNGSNNSTISALLPGQRVYALVGFCDIHHFEECLLALNQDVLNFVNSIAEIVHFNVHRWGGQCNKNLGNAFVIVWRIGDEVSILQSQQDIRKGRMSTDNSLKVSSKSSKNKVIDLKRIPGIDELADQALIGYLKVIADINRKKEILSYQTEPRLVNMLRGEQFKVRMGFGLHAGWAIEGAVGSVYKVDATYLSPHVNMAARLETSSRQYGVPLLMSHFFFELCSTVAQSKCRKIDVVTVKGSEVPIGLFTYDCLQDQIFPVENTRSKKPSYDQDDVETNVQFRNNTIGPVFLTEKDSTEDVFEQDADLLALRSHIFQEFVDTFNEGVSSYLIGDWSTARIFLEASNKLMVPTFGCDGPSKTLLEYMETRNWTAPNDWAGFRPLTSK